jgi:hypothetical protein
MDLSQKRLLKHVVEGKGKGGIEVMGRRRRRSKGLPDNLKETRGYWKFKNEALDYTLCKTRFRKICGSA